MSGLLVGEAKFSHEVLLKERTPQKNFLGKMWRSLTEIIEQIQCSHKYVTKQRKAKIRNKILSKECLLKMFTISKTVHVVFIKFSVNILYNEGKILASFIFWNRAWGSPIAYPRFGCIHYLENCTFFFFKFSVNIIYNNRNFLASSVFWKRAWESCHSLSTIWGYLSLSRKLCYFNVKLG